VASVGAPPAATAAGQPRLWLSNEDGAVSFGGRVHDATARDSVLAALRGAFGADRLRGEVAVDPGVTEAVPWLAGLPAALGQLRANGLSALFDGDTVSVGGLLNEADRDRLIASLRPLFGGLQVGSLAERVTAWSAEASQRAMTALAALGPGYSARNVVEALNQSIVNFAPGSAEVPTADLSLLRAAAERMRGLPGGSVIEIGGHTDNTGDAAANLALSQRRAEAVRTVLVEAGVKPAMLVAKGYGSTRPVASNDTPEGRFRNRRIAYAVVPAA
jgi:OOP family OmpA-OmpF porin